MDLPDNSLDRVSALHTQVKKMLKQGLPEDEIITDLTNQGISEDYAKLIILNIHNDISDRKNFWKLIFGGLFFIIGGLLINYFSYKIAHTANSLFFYLFWGIIVFGISLILKAFIVFRK